MRRFARRLNRSQSSLAAQPAASLEKGYRKLFDDAPIGLYRTLVNGELVEANPALAQILGYSSPDALIGTNAADFYLERDERARLQKLIEDHGGVDSWEVPLRRRDGTACWVRMSTRVFRDSHGNVSHYEGAIQDITELRRLNEELRESEAQYRVLFESNPQPMWVYDVTSFAFLAVNAAATSHYGYSRDEFLAMTVLDIRPEEDRIKFREYYARFEKQATRSPRGYGIWRHLHKDGATMMVDITSSMTSFGGRDAILVVANDVTERERTREQLEALSRQLVRAQEAAERRIARELHDQIGQQLTGLKFMLEAAETDGGALAPKVLADAREIVDQLMVSVQGLSLDLRPPALDRLGLVPALLGLLKRFTDRTRIEIDFAHSGVDRRFSPNIETATFRIIQEALTNVARHAGASRATVRVSAGDGAMSLQVEDKGSGFEVEQALQNRATAGLAGMQERVTALGGSLTIDTAPNSGTCILAELPLTEAAGTSR